MLRALPLLFLALTVQASAQESPPTAQKPAASAASLPPSPAVLRYPENKDAILAILDGEPVRLIQLGRFLQQRYDPQILERWALPEGHRELNSPLLGEMLWQYLDVLCLRKEAHEKKLPMSELQGAIDQELQRDFKEKYLKRYEKLSGRKVTEKSAAFLRSRHRRQSGLRIEVQCLLNGLVPREYKVSELRAFHLDHGHFFGGKVLVAHIHFATRDRSSGRRFSPDKLGEVRNRMRKAQAQLAKDPSSFKALAKQLSDDRVTGPKGGEIGWVTRFDERLPAVVVRTAWQLDQGEVSHPVESFYGYHLVKRVRFVQHQFLLPRQESYHKIAGAVQKVQQEDYLFKMRKRHSRLVSY